MLVANAGISPETVWTSLPRMGANELIRQLRATELEVDGKSLNKDEFVTCGGVRLREINFKSMESRVTSHLYFAGEFARRRRHRRRLQFPSGLDDRLDCGARHPAVAQGKVFFVSSDSSLYYVVDAATGKPVLREQAKAYMFSSPTVSGDVVFIGVLNGTLDARDLKTGALLWDYQTDASKQNKGWVLTSDRKFNTPLLFYSNWRKAPIVATDRQFSIGAIFSSPLVVNGVVYFGSTDGFLYALE